MTDIEIEKLKSESLIELRVIARNLGVKSVTTYNKSGLIEKIKEFAELENSSNKMGLSYNNGDRQEKSNEDFGILIFSSIFFKFIFFGTLLSLFNIYPRFINNFKNLSMSFFILSLDIDFGTENSE